MTPEQFSTTNQELRDNRKEQLRLRREIDARAQDIQSIQRQQALWTNAQVSDIATANNPETSKPLFANQEARAAQVLIRQTNSAEFTAWEDQLADLAASDRRDRDAIDSLKIDEHFLSNDLQYAIHSDAEEINRLMVEVAADIHNAAMEAVQSMMHAIANFTGAGAKVEIKAE